MGAGCPLGTSRGPWGGQSDVRQVSARSAEGAPQCHPTPSGRGGPALVTCCGHGEEKAAQTRGRTGATAWWGHPGGRGRGVRRTTEHSLASSWEASLGRHTEPPREVSRGPARPCWRMSAQGEAGRSAEGGPGQPHPDAAPPVGPFTNPARSLSRQSHTAGRTVLGPDAALGCGQRPAPGHTVGSVSAREWVREAGAPAATLQLVCQPGESLSAHPYPGPGARDLPLFGVGAMGLWTRVPSSMGRFPEGPQGRFR